MENPIKTDDLGGTTMLGNPHRMWCDVILFQILWSENGPNWFSTKSVQYIGEAGS